MQDLRNTDILCNPRVILYRAIFVLAGLFAVFFALNGFSIMLYFPSNVQHIKCTDTSCLLSVFGDKCYAKFEFYPDSKYELVDCRGQNLGYYNATIPCDVTDSNKPIIYCENTTIPDTLQAFIIIVLSIGSILIAMCCIHVSVSAGRIGDKYIESFVLNGDKKDPPDQINNNSGNYDSSDSSYSSHNFQNTNNYNLIPLKDV